LEGEKTHQVVVEVVRQTGKKKERRGRKRAGKKK
jgi:hypothetical protein